MTTELEPLAESPALNKLLVRNARKSAREIELLTGIPAAEVAERIDRLLDAGSLRDDVMEEKLIILQIADLVQDIQSRMSGANVDDEGWASMARVALASFKTMLEQIDKRRKNLDGKLATLTMEQVQDFAAVMRLNNELTAQSLALKHGIPVEEVYAEWEENLPKAIATLEPKTRA